MNVKLRKNAKNEFKKDFFKLVNDGVFRGTMENLISHRDIRFITTEAGRNY